jgi:ABC-2 type transport system permease protein
MNFFSNPVLVKELRGRIRGRRALIMMTVYLSLTAIVTLLIYLAVASSYNTITISSNAGREIGRAIFLTVMTAALLQVCVITPSLTAGSIAGEKERQSYDLLITTMLSPLQIALGKLVAALSFAALLIIAILPMAGLAFLFGGVTGTEFLIAIAGLAMTSLLYASVGIFWSTVMRGTLAATVMAQGTVILVLVGIPFIFVVSSALIGGGPDDDLFGLLYVYIMGTLLSLHPFAALGITAGLLSQGENPFYFSLPLGNQQDLLLPSPWLAFLFFGTLLTLMLIFLTVRLLRPVQYGLSRADAAAAGPPAMPAPANSTEVPAADQDPTQ